MQWHTLQQKQRQQSLTWWKNEELKKDEIEQRLIKHEEIHSCEYGSRSFLKNTEKVNIKLKENLVVCSGN